eukprot:jgi/Tetstr1/435071/TSEL_024040.t1
MAEREAEVRRQFPKFTHLKNECRRRGYSRGGRIAGFAALRERDYDHLIREFARCDAEDVGRPGQPAAAAPSGGPHAAGRSSAAASGQSAAADIRYETADQVRHDFPNITRLKAKCQQRGYSGTKIIEGYSKMGQDDYSKLVDAFLRCEASSAGGRAKADPEKEAAVDRFWKKQWSPALKKQCQDFVGVKGELRNITVKRLTVAALGQNSRIKPEDWEDPAFLTAVSPFGDATKYVTQEHLRKDAHAFGVDLRGRRTTSEILEALLQHTIQMARTGRGSEHRAASLDLPGMEELRREIFSYVVFDCEKPLADILSLPRLVQEAKLLLQWAKLDTMAATSSSQHLLKERSEWLEALRRKLHDRQKKLQGGSKDFQSVKTYLAAAKKMHGQVKCLQALGTFDGGDDAPPYHSMLRMHDAATCAESAFPVYRDSAAVVEDGRDDPEKMARELGMSAAAVPRNPKSFRADAYFARAPSLRLGADGPLRNPQRAAVEAARNHHSCQQGAVTRVGADLADAEMAAIQTLRGILFRAIRSTYFRPLDSAERGRLFERVLVLAPNLTIAGGAKTTEEKEKDERRRSRDLQALAEGLMKDFGDVERNFYKQRFAGVERSLLPPEAALPCAMTLKAGDKARTVEELRRADVVVTNYHQLKDKRLRQFPRDFFDAVIVDEAHHAAANSYKLIIDHFCCAHVAMLTATPFRSDRQQLAAKQVHVTSIKECIERKYIKDLAYCPVPVASYDLINTNDPAAGVTSVSGWDAIKAAGATRPTQDAGQRSRDVRESIMKATMQCLRWLRSRSGYKHQAIVQARDIDDARDLCKDWMKLQGSYPANNGEFRIDYVATLDGALSDEELKSGWHKPTKEVKKELYQGTLDIIVHIGMLGEGFDHKPLSVAAIFRPFRSIGSFNQFVGRAVRRDAGNPSPKPEEQVAYIISHPALGVTDQWTVFCEERQDEPQELSGGKKADAPCEIRNQQLAGSVFDPQQGVAAQPQGTPPASSTPPAMRRPAAASTPTRTPISVLHFEEAAASPASRATPHRDPGARGKARDKARVYQPA